jgi:uncharacterized protein YceK
MTRLILALTLCLSLTGCAGMFKKDDGSEMSGAAKLHLVKQAYNEASGQAASILRAGLVKDQATKDAIFLASEEVVAAIKDAEQTFATGDKLRFDYYLRRAQSALDRLVTINLRHQVPATRSTDAWQNKSSSPSFLRPSDAWLVSSPPTTPRKNPTQPQRNPRSSTPSWRRTATSCAA